MPDSAALKASLYVLPGMFGALANQDVSVLYGLSDYESYCMKEAIEALQSTLDASKTAVMEHEAAIETAKEEVERFELYIEAEKAKQKGIYEAIERLMNIKDVVGGQ